MVGLLAEIKIAIVRRDVDLPGLVVDLEIDAIARLESEQLEVRVDDGHPRQVWLTSFWFVRRAAEDHLKHGFRVLLLAFTEQRFNIGDSHFRLLV
ncbi:hypothetical protein ACVK00_002871 [Burkholderia sp. PvR073]|uniref:hypothetical protein n=1 Tax=Burkholderia TaxID=32008 RepID=UPI00255021B6|nr:hypothetical protein [Burkholderia sp. lyk4-R2A-23]